MKKLFLISIFSLNFLFANELISQAKIFPYLLIYDKNLKDKTFDGNINFLIIYDKFSKKSAHELQELIVKEHNDKLGDYNLITLLTDEPKIEYLKKASAIYLFDIDENYIKEVTHFAMKNSIITFANKATMLNKNIVVALLITKKVQPLINLKILKASNIKLSYKIFKVSKIHE